MGPGPAQGARPRFNNKARPRYNKARPRHDKARPRYYKARRRYSKARPRHYKARPLSRAAAQTRSRAAAQPLKFGARPQMPNHPDLRDDFGSYEDDLPLDDPSSGLKYKYARWWGRQAGRRQAADV